MADRFPPALLILMVIFTVAILIVSVAGIWEEGMPPDSGGGEPPATESDEGAEPPPDAKPAAPGTADDDSSDIVPAPSATRVNVIWKRLDEDQKDPAATPDRAWPVSRFEPPALPEVQGRMRVTTASGDAGVMEVRVVSGSSLAFAAKRVPGSTTETVLEYHGRGLHARIIELVTGSGARVRHFFRPAGAGGTTTEVELTPPGPLVGSVIDAEGRPVPGASVRIGDAITATDNGGKFRVAAVRGRHVLIHITAPRHPPHREIVTVPDGFGTARAAGFSPVIRLHPGVRLEVRVRVPPGAEHRGARFRFFLIPFAHRLTNENLAVELLGPLRSNDSDTLVVPGFPVGQEMCLVGIHPRMDILYRKIRAGDADVRIDLSCRARADMLGTVVQRGGGRTVTGFQLDTPLDTLTVGDYLVARRMIPGGHEPGNFPLPMLPSAILKHATDGKGGFHIGYDSGVRQEVRLRFRAEGQRTEIVPAAALHPGVEVRMGRTVSAIAHGASIELAIRLAGRPVVEGFTCEGLDPVARPVLKPGEVHAVIGNVPLGRYRIRVKAPGYASYTRTMSFTAATTRRIPVFLAVQ